MGYDLHITRAKFHYENEGQWISTAEWLHLIDTDPELRLAGYNGEYFALWSDHPADPESWFDWYKGNIYTKNPDEALIDKMVEMAKKLDAKVQGDDGEIYMGGGVNNVLPPPNNEVTAPTPKNTWWKKLFGW